MGPTHSFAESSCAIPLGWLAHACARAHPLLLDELQAAAGPDVRLIDGSAGIARRVAYLTEGQNWTAEAAPGVAVFTRSDDRPPPPLAALAPYGIGRIETI